MKEALNDMSRRQAAILGGIAILVMLVGVILAVPNTTALIVDGDAAKTFQNIKGAGVWFRVGIVGWFVVLICDVIVSLAFYVFLKPTNQSLSLLTAWLRLVYTAIFAVVTVSLLVVLLLLDDSKMLSTFSTAQRQELVLFALKIFAFGWMFGLAFFGFHLAGLGYLSLRSEDVPNVIGILLLLAAVGYVGDTMLQLLMTHYAAYKSTIKAIVSGPNAIGELAFAMWVLIKGGKASAHPRPR